MLDATPFEGITKLVGFIIKLIMGVVVSCLCGIQNPLATKDK